MNDDCPNKNNHTKSPSGYLEWHSWAAKKSKRHYQIVCKGCGRFSIWKRYKKHEPDYGGLEDLRDLAENID